ncbi:uncharacterized protein LOC110107896 [Dendrobium catenatum]|uniref:uncharacterized protein LOC110107896 n=1 Tax=Dendrobium catenatum TaxID=906689 RepID=UPI0009F2B4E4|nr:uncharacterized protein LOC110107896 [Dendrobium catenatum]
MSVLLFFSPKVIPHPLLSLRRTSSSHSPLISAASFNIPARDRVIDFGKHRGRMLGSLPSSYLSWISNNLRAGDFLDWARLADEVLADPVYRDRLEWESAERLLAGAAGCRRPSDSPLADLLSVSETFGWDNGDKEGWARVDLDLLGTSMGGRIPRRSSEMEKGHALGTKVGVFREGEKVRRGTEERREKRRERRMIQMEKLKKEAGHLAEGAEERESRGDGVFVEKKRDLGDKDAGWFVNISPGRGTLLEKIKKGRA